MLFNALLRKRNTNLKRALAAGVKARRTELSLSLGEFAERAGLSTAVLTSIENATSNPNLATIVRIAAVLRCDPAALFAPVQKYITGEGSSSP